MPKFTMEFLNEYLAIRKIDKARLSTLIKDQILLNLESSDRVVEEIACLEGNGVSETKAPKKLRRVLKGYWHKHYNSSRFMGKNIMNYWEMEKESSKKLENMLLEISEAYVKNNKSEDLMGFSLDAAKRIADGYIKRSDSKELTGEWIVFKKNEGLNYYLTLADHLEKDANVLARAESCREDFPFLFE